jgi:hypothetical protein
VGVPAKDLAVQPERDHTLLDACSAALVETDQRTARLQCEVEDLDDLLAVHFAQAAAKDRHVLAEDAHRAAVNSAETGDNAIAVRALLLQPE